MASRKALGILGGTFDPVHYGHLVAAQCVAYEFHLDRVIFIPAAQPPHKNASEVLSAEHRLAMVKLAIADNPAFELSSLEIDRSGISYTVDTIETLRQTYPDTDLYSIMGMDSVYILATWKDIERLAAMCRFIVVTRPAYQLDRSEPALQKVPEVFWAQADFLEVPAVGISSTDLRCRVQQGRTIRYLLPPAVEKYIYDHSLYRKQGGQGDGTDVPETTEATREPSPGALKDKQIMEIIHKRLSGNRYQHSLRVAEAARSLAEQHQVDPRQAYTTGLLHDYAKGLSGGQLLDLAQANNLIQYPADRLLPDLLHGPVGACLVKKELGIENADMLSAIANHTLGALDMGRMEEIIFLADMIEPGRDYPGLERLKCLAMRSLEEGMLFGMETTIRYCIDQGRIIHPRSIEVRNHYLQKCSTLDRR